MSLTVAHIKKADAEAVRILSERLVSKWNKRNEDKVKKMESEIKKAPATTDAR